MTGVEAGRRPAPPGIAARLGELLTFVRFAFVGGAATAIHMATAGLLIAGAGVPVFSANLAAFLTAFVFAFSGHFFWTFRGRGRFARALTRYFAIALAAFLVNNLLLLALVRQGWLGDLYSTLIAATVVPLISYAASRLWGFREAT